MYGMSCEEFSVIEVAHFLILISKYLTYVLGE